VGAQPARTVPAAQLTHPPAPIGPLPLIEAFSGLQIARRDCRGPAPGLLQKIGFNRQKPALNSLFRL